MHIHIESLRIRCQTRKSLFALLKECLQGFGNQLTYVLVSNSLQTESPTSSPTAESLVAVEIQSETTTSRTPNGGAGGSFNSGYVLCDVFYERRRHCMLFNLFKVTSK